MERQVYCTVLYCHGDRGWGRADGRGRVSSVGCQKQGRGVGRGGKSEVGELPHF